MLHPEHLKNLARCQTKQTAASADAPFVADNGRGRESIVPPGKQWKIHRVSVLNTDLDTMQPAYVWLVPAGEGVEAATTEWLVYPGNDIAAGDTEFLVPDADSQVVEVMDAGDFIMIMGGGTNINVRVIGWEVPA